VTPSKLGKARGFALIMVLMLVVVLLILIGALLDFMPVELSAASYTGYDDRSLYAADSGIQYATESLENAAASGYFPTPAPMPAGTPFATVYLDPSPAPSAPPDAQVWIQASEAGNGLATYYITSIGNWHGVSHRVDAVVAQRPFNSRAYVAKNNAKGNYFVSGLMSYDGPV
jgi:Tfp pilus assembly protein PilX